MSRTTEQSRVLVPFFDVILLFTLTNIMSLHDERLTGLCQHQLVEIDFDKGNDQVVQ